MRRIAVVGLVIALLLAMAAPAFALPGKPSSNGVIYADGNLYRSKAAANLPAPNGHNLQSFDKLFDIAGQPNVSEAAPGDRSYNGGRWEVISTSWTDPTAEHSVLMSIDDVYAAVAAGELDIGGPVAYLECPLLALK